MVLYFRKKNWENCGRLSTQYSLRSYCSKSKSTYSFYFYLSPSYLSPIIIIIIITTTAQTHETFLKVHDIAVCGAPNREALAPVVAMAARRECGGRHGNIAPHSFSPCKEYGKRAPRATFYRRRRRGGGSGVDGEVKAVMKRRKSNFALSQRELLLFLKNGCKSMSMVAMVETEIEERRNKKDVVMSHCPQKSYRKKNKRINNFCSYWS